MSTTNHPLFVPAAVLPEGAGVTVHRTIGTQALRNYDPFLLLDHINSDNPQDYIAGFPAHPHRGFKTFTYIIDGAMEHIDSLGNTGILNAGDAQWMKAASGIIHSEMPKQNNGLLRGFQLWINLPAANKMDTPEYLDYPATAFPVVTTADYSIKVLSGCFENRTGPIVDHITPFSFFDVQVKPGGHLQHAMPSQDSSFLYIFEGSGRINGQSIAVHTLATLDDTNTCDFTAGKSGARFVLVSGSPVNEPIVQQGPFVMNSQAEIDEAVRDYQSNNFVRNHARINHKYAVSV